MATTPPPGTVRFEPRGRPVIAMLGLIVALAGIGLMSLLAANVPSPISGLSKVLSTATPTSGPTLQPSGSKPAGFVAYSDPKGHFALYVSSTWHSSATTITLGSTSSAATSFAPAGTTLPDWVIADLPNVGSSTDITALARQIVQSQGGTGLTPSGSVDSVTEGSYQWSHLAATTQLRGATVALNVYLSPLGQGSVLVFDEALSISATQTDQQDFVPMLISLTLATS